MTALQLIRQLAMMTTPADEFEAFAAGHPDVTPTPTLEDWEDELSSDRMEDDARALWRMIDAARECLRDTASAEAKLNKTLDAFTADERL